METMIDRVRKNSTIAILFGILLIVAGIAAMATPVVAGLSVALVVGWLLVFGGVVQIAFAFAANAGFWAIVWSLLTLGAGIYMVMNPGVALASLVMLLAIYLLLTGIAEAITAFAARPASGWGWLLFGAITSIALGGLMFTQFPVAGAMALGFLLGFKLLFSGLTLLMLALTVRKATKEFSAG